MNKYIIPTFASFSNPTNKLDSSAKSNSNFVLKNFQNKLYTKPQAPAWGFIVCSYNSLYSNPSSIPAYGSRVQNL